MSAASVDNPLAAARNLVSEQEDRMGSGQKTKRPKLPLRPWYDQLCSSSDHLEVTGARLAALSDQLVADLLRLIEG